MIICVHHRYDDPTGDHIGFVELNGTDPIYVNEIRKAMNHAHKQGWVDCATTDKIYDQNTKITYANLPCIVDDMVMLWMDA